MITTVSIPEITGKVFLQSVSPDRRLNIVKALLASIGVLMLAFYRIGTPELVVVVVSC